MSYNDETLALCALNKIFGYHPALLPPLLQEAGSAVKLLDGSYAYRGDAFSDVGGDSFSLSENGNDVHDAGGKSLSDFGGDAFSGAKKMADASENASPSSVIPSSSSIFPHSSSDISQPSSPPPFSSLFQQLVPSQLEWARRELERVEAGGFRFLTLYDEDYPEVLREIPDAPIGLYLNGSSSPTEIFGLRPMVGIVGTRDISPYGREWCRKLVEALSSAAVQPCIVSGLAIGADGIAHKTALDGGLGTVGVMATGIDQVYPWQHTQLAMSMVRTPGCCLVTDYPLGTSPVAVNFLRRNRIIAGLVSAVIVVESKSRGGSLVTAKYAVDYAREVYALPGRIDDARSAGCNSLIASNMAQLITSPEELVGQLGLGRRVRGPGGSWATGWTEARFRQMLQQSFGDSGAAVVAVGMAVREHRGVRAEDLAALTGLPFASVLESIGLLEARGIIGTDLLRRCSLTPQYT